MHFPEVVEVGKESGCRRFVSEKSLDLSGIAGEETQCDDGTGGITNDRGPVIRRDIVDQSGCVICISLKTLRVVLRAGEVASRETTTCTAV